MNEENPEQQEEQRPERQKSLEEVMSSGNMARSPLFWGVLIFIPIAVTLFLSVKHASQQRAAIEAQVVEKEAVKITPRKPAKPIAGRGAAF